MLSHVFHQVRISLILSFVLVCASVFGMTGYAHADDEMPNGPAPTREMAQEEQNHTSGALAHRIGIDAPSKGDMTHDVQITGQASASGTLAPEPGDAPDSKPRRRPTRTPSIPPRRAGTGQLMAAGTTSPRSLTSPRPVGCAWTVHGIGSIRPKTA